MRIIPRNDYALIERIESKYSGKITIPDSAKELGFQGKVLAVGPGKLIEGINGGLVRQTPQVKPGDIVIFNTRWNDLASSHHTEDIAAHFDRNLHLVQEADIFLRVNA